MMYKIGLKRSPKETDYIWVCWDYNLKQETDDVNEAYREREVCQKLYPHYTYVVIEVEK